MRTPRRCKMPGAKSSLHLLRTLNASLLPRALSGGLIFVLHGRMADSDGRFPRRPRIPPCSQGEAGSMQLPRRHRLGARVLDQAFAAGVSSLFQNGTSVSPVDQEWRRRARPRGAPRRWRRARCGRRAPACRSGGHQHSIERQRPSASVSISAAFLSCRIVLEGQRRHRSCRPYPAPTDIRHGNAADAVIAGGEPFELYCRT